MKRRDDEGDSVEGPAYYSRPNFLRGVRSRQWWTVLHPPYTALHLSLVTLGGCWAAPVNFARLAVSELVFFAAVGVGAHCLDEVHGRPLSTTIPRWQLILAATLGLGTALAFGVVGLFVVSRFFALFMVVGLIAALGYNLELFGGRLHTDLVLVTSWGALPVLTAYFAQHATLSISALFVATFGALVTLLQRTLSTPARHLRRRVTRVEGQLVLRDGALTPLDLATLLAPHERGLRILCWSGPVLALGLLALRITGT